MNYLKFFLIPIFLIVCSLDGFSQKSPISPNIRRLKNDTIIWKVDSLLHKEDFKARSRSNGPLGFSALGIFLYPGEDGGQIVFYVEALFVKSKSYITKFSEYVLKHEQIHFNICELYARKLRQKISEINFKKVKNIASEMSDLYNKTDQELVKEQNKYDKDTEHGLNSAKQKIWEDDIQKHLVELEKYSSTLVTIVK